MLLCTCIGAGGAGGAVYPPGAAPTSMTVPHGTAAPCAVASASAAAPAPAGPSVSAPAPAPALTLALTQTLSRRVMARGSAGWSSSQPWQESGSW